jgi:hypothetical protein
MTAPFQPTLSSVIRRAVEEGAADLHVSLPGRVEKVVDADKGIVDVKPLVSDRVEVAGELRVISVPVVTNVPLMWPGGSRGGITWDIAVGDTVLLVFSDRSLDRWLAMSGEVDPEDPRRHALSDAVAIPGLRSFKEAVGGAAHPAAWADAIRTELDAIWTAIYGHTHPVPCAGLVSAGPGQPVTGAAVASSAPGSPSKQTIASATVKIRG